MKVKSIIKFVLISFGAVVFLAYFSVPYYSVYFPENWPFHEPVEIPSTDLSVVDVYLGGNNENHLKIPRAYLFFGEDLRSLENRDGYLSGVYLRLGFPSMRPWSTLRGSETKNQIKVKMRINLNQQFIDTWHRSLTKKYNYREINTEYFGFGYYISEFPGAKSSKILYTYEDKGVIKYLIDCYGNINPIRPVGKCSVYANSKGPIHSHFMFKADKITELIKNIGIIDDFITSLSSDYSKNKAG